MKNLILIQILFTCLVTAGLYAGETKTTISFFIGDVTVSKDGGKTVPAQINMVLNANDVIKTGKGSQAEIQKGSESFYVDENKTVRVSNLLPGGKPPVLVHALKKIQSNTRQSKITTIAAVRAEKQEEEIAWASDSSSAPAGKSPSTGGDDEILSKMASLLSSEQFEKARQYHADASVSEKSRNRMDFMGGIAYFHLCRYHEALTIFTKLAKKPSDKQVNNESTFYAGLCFYTTAKHADALPYLNRYIENQPDGVYTVQSYFLRGVIYLNTGKKDRAKEDLFQVKTLFPSDPLAKDAEAILKDIKD